MGVIRDTLSKIFPKRKQDKQPLKQEESNLLPEEKPVVEQVSKDMIESTIAEISKNSNETKETQIQPLSAAEKVARLGKSVGFDVRVMTPDEAKNKSDKAKAVQVETNGNLKPSIDDLYLIRATDIFPEDSTMKPISNSLRMASFTTPYFIDRVLTQEAAKLGIKQKNGKPVTCRTDLNNVELSQELIDYLNNLDLGQDFEGHRTHPTDRLIASVKHKAISKFELPLRSTRETVHFTMNSRVSSHSGGNWENLPFIFIEPYKPHHGTFRSVGGFDSWKKGDVHLESPTLLTRPETLEQLIELSKTNPGIKSTLKDCKVVLMNTEQTHDSHYVNAILHEQGAPAYVCGDTFVLAVESDKNQNNQIQAKGR